mgnify:CR=1 FL=1
MAGAGRGHSGSGGDRRPAAPVSRCWPRRKPAATGRFAEPVVAVRGLPRRLSCPSSASSLAPACRAHRTRPPVRANPRDFRKARASSACRFALAGAMASATEAFLAPLKEAQARSAEPSTATTRRCRRAAGSRRFHRSHRSGNPAVYQTLLIDSAAGEGPRPLACAFELGSKVRLRKLRARGAGEETGTSERRACSSARRWTVTRQHRRSRALPRFRITRTPSTSMPAAGPGPALCSPARRR